MNKRNEQGHRHGYWEEHHDNGIIKSKSTYNNGVCGYTEFYYIGGELMYKGFLESGYWGNIDYYYYAI